MAVQNALPLVGNSSVGVRTSYATLLPAGSKVAAYVGATQDDSLDAYSASTLLVPTLAAGLARCRAGKGDIVIVLPGHTETVSDTTMLDNLVSGTQIMGVAPFGSSLMPTFTFSATTASWALNDANCTISGLKFATSVDTVDNYITVTAAGCQVTGNYFQCGTATGVDCDVPLTLGTGATDCLVTYNKFISTSTAVNTNLILVSGTAVDGFEIRDNFLHGNCATNGLINITGTAVGFLVDGNKMFNTTGTAPVGIRHTDTALVGLMSNNVIAFTTDATVLTAGISAAGVATANVRYINNWASDEDSLGGILTPTATGLE